MMNIFRLLTLPIILLVVGVGWLIRPNPAHANNCTVTVTDNADSGPNTLRAAINDVCDGGTIDFGFAMPTTITLTSDTLTLSRTVTIDGSTAPTITINGNNAYQGFVITNSATVSLTSMTVRNGAGAQGGGIYNEDGALTLTAMHIISNSAVSGGGITQNSGSLTIRNSTIAENMGVVYGGGVDIGGGVVDIAYSLISDNVGGTVFDGGGISIFTPSSAVTMTIRHTTIADNSLPDEDVNGGGIGIVGSSNVSNPTTVYVTHSTIVGNSAPDAGAIYVRRAHMEVANSTISGNSATNRGGAISTGGEGTVTIINSTVASNNAAVSGGGFGNNGSVVTLTNSIIADNNAPTGPDCGAIIFSNGHNLIESTAGCLINGDATDDIYGMVPRLEPLADNGGSTHTHALLADSPAIDGGLNSVCNADPINGVDQRGVTRALGGATCDIGAFEYIAPQTTLSDLSPTSGPESGGTLLTLTGTHFGVADATVLIGGQPCLNVTHDAATPDTLLTCTTPIGQGVEQPVVVIAFGQVSNPLYFDYESHIPLNQGWNLVGYPLHVSQPVTEALSSIDGFYTTVYGYDAFDTVDPWRMYDATVPPNFHSLVNDLTTMEFAEGYWIYATQPVTWVLTSFDERTPNQTISMLPPPATYYGVVQDGGAMAGQTVEATIGGVSCGNSDTVAMPDSSIAYVVHVAAAGDTALDCGTTGAPVIFSVDSMLMTPFTPWDSTQAHQITLTPGAPTSISLVAADTHTNFALLPVLMLFIVFFAIYTRKSISTKHSCPS